MKNIDLQQALNQIDNHKGSPTPDWIGLREVYERISYRGIRDGNPTANHTKTTHGIMVEVMVDGQIGYSGTNQMDTNSLQKAAEQAYQQAKIAANWSIASFNPSVRPKAVGEYHSPFEIASDVLSPGELNQFLKKVDKQLKVADNIVSTLAFVRIDEVEMRVVCTNGSDIHQKFLMPSTHYQAIAQEGSLTQKRSEEQSQQMGMELYDEEATLQRAQTIGEQAVELLNAEECPTETTHIVLAPDQMMLQIHESVGHPLELDRILGDERNYAGWSFVKPEDFGNLQYGSPLMNITFDPTRMGEHASYNFDDGGMASSKEYLIKKGKLVRGLGGMESQARLNIPGVACFRASSWNRAPIDRMANLNLEAGTSTADELIGSIENGVYMETNRSWSIDDYRNKFQFGCEYAKRIENGKLTTTLKNPNYRGISTPFWRNLKRVGNADTVEKFGTPFCGKGEPNQAIRVGHASPLCSFESVEIFGGAT